MCRNGKERRGYRKVKTGMSDPRRGTSSERAFLFGRVKRSTSLLHYVSGKPFRIDEEEHFHTRYERQVMCSSGRYEKWLTKSRVVVGDTRKESPIGKKIVTISKGGTREMIISRCQ